MTTDDTREQLQAQLTEARKERDEARAKLLEMRWALLEAESWCIAVEKEYGAKDADVPNLPLVRVIRAALTDAEPLLQQIERLQQEQWSPVETMPPYEQGEPAVLVFTELKQVRAAARTFYGEWLSLPGRYPVKPTHWMPLPSAPVAKDGQEQERLKTSRELGSQCDSRTSRTAPANEG
jgi:hypothetical protein